MLAALLPATAWLHAQEWRLERYTADEGLPQNTVSSLAMDPSGYVWALTDGGLVRFDGHTVQRVPMPASDGGPQRLREIVDLQNGTFAIRDSRSRRFLLDQGRVSTLGDPAIDRDPYPLLRGAAPSLEAYEMAASRLWRDVRSRYGHIMLITLSEHEWVASTTHGLSHFRDTTLIGHVPQQSTRDRYFQIGNTIYATDSSNRPFRVDLGDHTMHPVAWKGPMPQAAQLTADFFDPWWQTNDRTPSFHIGRELCTIGASADGDTLIATPLGLELPEAGDLDAILVALDKGVVLVGTKAQGLLVYRRTTMHTVKCATEGVGRNNIYYAQAAVGTDRVLAMAGYSARILSINGCDTTPTPIDTFNYQGIARDRLGRYWYGQDSLICRYDPSTRERWSTSSWHSWEARVFTLWPEGDSIWVGTDHGIGYVKDDRFHVTLQFPARTRSSDPYCIRRGPDGALWYTSCGGVYRLDRTAQHATLVRGSQDLCVRTLERIGQRMYMGSYGSGGWVYENDSLHRLPRDRMGYLDHVHAFMPDR
ncbi:MAG TPA: two-component regulator propeller domain-containing protein, partial [Flavobacteriales bacterium]|nr:two-component regulator propeller domain-containing protein [Flavobacteriales bacterium]